ncbi:interleukin-13 receptor subunit alpha-1-like [Pyxicephalus adspersus]|uniref:interleukin-13 receptor subunit alpha-1-like n=1 Tax=Pyxicephalus adspersus TaxID=30357 RepID=UPI003B58BD24
MEFTIHKGLKLRILSYKVSQIREIWYMESFIVTPEGKPDTAAEHFSCEIFLVSYVDCSWMAGREAPEDTQYQLVLRQFSVDVPCQDYRTDSFGRQVGCHLKSPNIDFNTTVYALVVGWSNETSVQFLDALFILNDYEILEPPRNIDLNYSSTDLEITWEKPKTHDRSGTHCFIYSININGNITGGIKGNSYRTNKLPLNENVNVSMRAKWDLSNGCSKNRKWSRWSEPHIFEYFSCVIYDISSMKFSWNFGTEVPGDTRFSLILSKKKMKITCQDYQTDYLGRQVGCILRSPNVSFERTVCVDLVGHNNKTLVRSIRGCFKPNDLVILDPPRIHVSYNSTDLEMTWETPKTHSNVSEHCFIYGININEAIIENIKGKSYITSRLHLNEKLQISMRAKWDERCSSNNKWSGWSDRLRIGPNSTHFAQNIFLIVLGIVAAALLFFLRFLCYRFQISKRFFPSIPEPAAKLFDHFEENGLSEQNMMEMERRQEDEDCVSLHIMEIPPMEQYVNTMMARGCS